MKDYILIKKSTLIKWIVVIAVGVAALGVWHHMRYMDWGFTPPHVETRSYNMLKANGKEILYFRGLDSDSVFLGLTLSNTTIKHAALCPVNDNALHRIVEINRNSLDGTIRRLNKTLGELDYYLGVNGVQDEGYDMVVAHAAKVKADIESAERLKAALDVAADATQLEIKRVATSIRLDSTDMKPYFMGMFGGVWEYGHWIKKSRKGRGVGFDYSGRLVAGIWDADTLVSGVRFDKEGIYSGLTNRYFNAHGHGSFEEYDGDYYEGHWENGLQSGFGFYVDTLKLRVGEWKNGKYRGERMNYTSDRIYGIDISKYQHGKGRKYYPIKWKQLRIVNLGNSSKKRVSGTVDYPVSFLYIKSTEGTTVRNRYYSADYRQARRHGFKCGAYHFFSFRTTGTAQAKYFLRHTYFRKGDLSPVLDVEPTDKQIKTMGGTSVLFARIRQWMSAVERRTGVKPILYVNQRFVNKYLNLAPDIKKNYKVWIARYGEYKPDVKLSYWQLSPDGRVRGITGDVDINVFNGYKAQFDEFLEENCIK